MSDFDHLVFATGPAAPADEGLVIRDIWLQRIHALSARANGEDTAYRNYRDRYRALATSLGFEGHPQWAEATPWRRSAF